MRCVCECLCSVDPHAESETCVTVYGMFCRDPRVFQALSAPSDLSYSLTSSRIIMRGIKRGWPLPAARWSRSRPRRPCRRRGLPRARPFYAAHLMALGNHVDKRPLTADAAAAAAAGGAAGSGACRPGTGTSSTRGGPVPGSRCGGPGGGGWSSTPGNDTPASRWLAEGLATPTAHVISYGSPRG